MLSKKQAREALEAAEYEWMGLGDVTKIAQADNPFFNRSKADIERPDLHLLRIISDPDYFGFTCKHVLGLTMAPFQLAVLKELWARPFPMLIGSRGCSKSFTLGVYAVLRALLSQGSKVVIVGTAFRQSKAVFEYAERIWNSSPVLRELVGAGPRKAPNGPHRETDRWLLRLGESTISALPLGTGESIRGQRACVGGDTLILDGSRGLLEIGDYEYPSPVHDGRGLYEYPAGYLKTGVIPAYEVVCEGGLSFVCSEIHKTLLAGGGKTFAFPKEGDFLSFAPAAWPSGLPEHHAEDEAFVMGFLSSTQKKKIRWSRPSLCVKGQGHRALASRVASACPGAICRHDEESGSVSVLSQAFYDRVVPPLRRPKAAGVPVKIRSGGKAGLLAYLRGLFYNASRSRKRVTLSGVSAPTARHVQAVLASFGVLGRIKKNYQFGKAKISLSCHGKDAGNLARLLDGEEIKRPRKRIKVLSVRRVGDRHLYDFCMPSSHSFWGQGLCQHNTHLLVDEFSTVNPDVYEVVIKGFAAVSASPVERMRQVSRFNSLKASGMLGEGARLDLGCNQTVLSGTAYYTFNHFYRYWRRYKTIIESGGDPKKLLEAFAGEEPPEGLDHRDFCVIRLPVELIPSGFMDEKTIASARATMHSGNYALEYSAVFSADSAGFYKRSVIERCVSGRDRDPIYHASCPGGAVSFSAALKGAPGRKYAMGVDPAIEVDNFAIVLLEIWPDHRRIVHCWTTRKRAFMEAVKAGRTHERDFYRFAARKIRLLHRLFPCSLIAVDGQGGGGGILQALQDPTYLSQEDLLAGDRALLPIIEEDEEKPTDDMPGEHIVHVVEFSRSDWVSEANNGMRLDFEDRCLLFPAMDEAEMALALAEDKEAGRGIGGHSGVYDTLEDCVLEIEELKDELATIVHTQTGTSGRDKWDTPEIKLPGGRKGRQRKDRYSALLMANAQARAMARAPAPLAYEGMGRVARGISKKDVGGGPGYVGPAWFTDKVNGLGAAYGAVAKKKR